MESRECWLNHDLFYSLLVLFVKQATQQASSSSPKLSDTSRSSSSLENTEKTHSSLASSLSRERQSWIDIVNSSAAADDEGQSITLAVNVHSPAPSEANSRKALENSCATSESEFLNSLSSDDTSSLSSNLDHLTVPDKPTGSKMADRGKPRSCLIFSRERIFVSRFETLRLICKKNI